MKPTSNEIIVAGHICVDIIPQFPEGQVRYDELLRPGKLTVVGPATISTGGSVSNTGIALNRLGLPAVLMGKVGDDLYGRALIDALRTMGNKFTQGMIVAKGETTSYSVVISPPGVDRMFLHCPGANDTFGIEDIGFTNLGDAKLFHFGYPPIMRRMFIDGGVELEGIFMRARQKGMTTSLDMSMPDPASESGRADWKALLERVLPQVDIFLPSFEEILFMLNRRLFDDLMSGSVKRENVLENGELLGSLAEELIRMGAPVIGIKLGEDGLYLKTSSDQERVKRMGNSTPRYFDRWIGRELLVPCFEVEVAGTTGAGDSTIAGFLAGLVFGLSPEQTMRSAAGVGAFNVEKADATSGIPTWQEVQDRISAGWKTRPFCFAVGGWSFDEKQGVWHAKGDSVQEADRVSA